MMMMVLIVTETCFLDKIVIHLLLLKSESKPIEKAGFGMWIFQANKSLSLENTLSTFLCISSGAVLI